MFLRHTQRVRNIQELTDFVKISEFLYDSCTYRVPLIFTFFRYQWGSLTIDTIVYGKSKTGFGSSVALIETRGRPFEGIAQFFTSYGALNGVSQRKTPFEEYGN